MAGRPSKYNQEIQKKAEKYLKDSSELWEIYTEQRVNKWGKVENVEKQRPAEMPSKWNLALYLGVHRETLDYWAKDYCQFSDILECIKLNQMRFLSYHGLNKNWDSPQTKMHQANLFGWSEKIQTENTNKEIQISIDADDAEL